MMVSTTLQAPIRIVIADDHRVVRESIIEMLNAEPDFEVVGSGSDAEQALEIIQDTEPDIALFDIDMPGLTCFDAIRRLRRRQPRCKVVFLSAFFHDHYIQQAIALEARGYVTKCEPYKNLAQAIRQAAADRVYFSPEVRMRILADTAGAKLSHRSKTRLASLSPREVDVLRLLARGDTKKEIGRLLHISVKTVEGHTQSLMKKLDIHDRVALARYAIREGLAEA
jgi:DNA-binding NarL/FixJ family response regulator